MGAPMPPSTKPTIAEAMASIRIGETVHKVIEIRATGDIILDVTFENTNDCTKSIPSDLYQKLRISKTPITSARVFYRARLDTLKKHSKYFQHLLGSDVFGEGRLISSRFAEIAQSNLKPSELEPDALPRIKIVDEDNATGTIGRESVFHDLLRIIHGAEHFPKIITINYMAVLAVMADRFDCKATVAQYVTGNGPLSKFKYPSTYGADKSIEEILRQKILVFYITNQPARFASSTKELILRGSSRWSGLDEGPGGSQAIWWDLPDGLEAELAYRRTRILATISSLQMHFLSLYTSRVRQCSLGYDSSAACDSYQLGEMVKFLTNKGMLSLVPMWTTSAEDNDYVWPEAYSGDIEHLIGVLRQCPSYQIDKNHSHCGLRSRILPALDYIQTCVDAGISINHARWRSDRSQHTWINPKPMRDNGRKPFVVGGKAVGEDETRVFDFAARKSPGLEFRSSSFGFERVAKTLFTAEKWNWTVQEDNEKITRQPGKLP